jgi:hypothetical protein
MTRANFTIIPNEALPIAVKSGLRLSDVLVYLAIAQHAGTGGKAWPSIARIAELTGIIDKSNVAKSIRQLEKAGLLTRARRRNNRGTWDSTTYTLAYLEPVVTPYHQSSGNVEPLDEPASGNVEPAPVVPDYQLNRLYEQTKKNPPLGLRPGHPPGEWHGEMHAREGEATHQSWICVQHAQRDPQA